MSVAHVLLWLAEPPTAPEGPPPPTAMDLGLAVVALLDILRSVAALAGQLAAGISCGSAPSLVPLAPDVCDSRRAISAPRAAASCAFAHHVDVRGGSEPSERVQGLIGYVYVMGRVVICLLLSPRI
jgi:hypothetical protein